MGQYIDAVHDKMQYNALHAAADFGHVEIIELLLYHTFSQKHFSPKLIRPPASHIRPAKQCQRANTQTITNHHQSISPERKPARNSRAEQQSGAVSGNQQPLFDNSACRNSEEHP